MKIIIRKYTAVLLAVLISLSVFAILPAQAVDVNAEEAVAESIPDSTAEAAVPATTAPATTAPATAAPATVAGSAEAVATTAPAVKPDKEPNEPVGAEASEEPVGANYSEDWRYWAQGASDDAQMREVGCFVVAQAKLLRETGIASDPGFNPDVYMNWEIANGHVDSSLAQNSTYLAPIAYAAEHGKTLDYIGDLYNPTPENFYHYLDSGFFTIIDVSQNGNTHFVYMNNEKTRETGEIWIYQSRNGETASDPIPLYPTYPNPVRAIVYAYAGAPQPHTDPQPAVPDSGTYEADSRFVPNWVFDGSTVKHLYNLYTAQMLINFSAWAYGLDEGSASWADNAWSKYGYTQFRQAINSGVYELEIGEETVTEEYTDSNGNKQTRQVTRQNKLTAVNAEIALKEVSYNGKTKYAVVVAFRGTEITDLADVIADINFLSNGNGIHRGFANNASIFYEKTKAIYFDVGDRCMSLYNMIQDMKNPDSPYCMLVTGHSLGAALAEVFVGDNLYSDGIYEGNVMAYTFAAPKCSSSERTRSNIFNFINSEDPITTVGGSYHIGTDIVYTPDDAFRENYGDRSFPAHRIPTSYRPMINMFNQVDGDGNAYINNYRAYHTNANVSIGNNNITFSELTYNNFDGNLTINNGMKIINGAKVTVNGNCTINRSLEMTYDGDYLLVNGNLTMSLGNNSPNSLTAGTVEVKGDFAETYSSSGLYSNHYWETGTHKTIFSGNSVQNVSFVTPGYNCFENPYFRNPHINFTTGIYSLRLVENTVIDSTEVLKPTSLYLNGYSLTTTGDANLRNFYAENSALTCNNLTIPSLSFNNTCITVNGNCTINNYLEMTHDGDYLLVNGNLTMSLSNNSPNSLTAGTVEVKGEFAETYSSPGLYSNHYWETETHKTIFSGSSVQNVSFVTPGYNCFENPYFRNPHINFTTGINTIRLVENTVIDSTGVLKPTNLYLNGFTLTTPGDIETNIISGAGSINCNSMTVSDSFTVNGNSVINGNLTVQKLIFRNNNLTVKGNCTINNYFEMTHDGDYLLVNGNLTMDLYNNGSSSLSAGTVEVKGDFAETCSFSGLSGKHYWETGTHKTVFSGNSVQNVSFVTPGYNCFENPYFRNPHINFTTGIYSLRLVENTVIDSTEVLKPTSLYLNGYSLTTTGDANLRNFYAENSALTCNNLTIPSLSFNNTCITVNGNCTINNYLEMTHDGDYLLVNGNLTMSLSNNSPNSLTAGTVEVKGEFAETYSSSGLYSNHYWETETHKTIFSGSSVQNVSFVTPGYNCFENPYFRNPHVNFTTGIYSLRLAENTLIDSTGVLKPTNLYLNGFTLTTPGDIETNIISGAGSINCNSMTVSDSFTVNGNSVINGNLTVQKLIFRNNNLTVKGNCTINNYFEMTHDGDYLLVNKNLTMSLRNNSPNSLTAGTVEVKGDFAETYSSSGLYSNHYWETATHKTVFSGNSVQNVSFVTPGYNCFENPYFRNPHINFTTGIYSLRLVENTVIDSTEVLKPTNLYLNGYSLTTTGDANLTNLYAENSAMTCNDLTIPSLSFNNTCITVNGNCTINSSLYMTHDGDYLLVNGNLTMRLYNNGSSSLFAGTVEVKGDFAEASSSSYSNYQYWETGTHKTIFSGNSVQNVSFAAPGYNRFETLILRNYSEDGVVFNSNITAGRLFNHNNCRFTLYNNGSGSTFVDFDGDGLMDNFDQMPLDSTLFVLGDVNRDGLVDVLDSMEIQKFTVDKINLTGSRLLAADVNLDGEVNILDALFIRKYAVEMYEFPDNTGVVFL